MTGRNSIRKLMAAAIGMTMAAGLLLACSTPEEKALKAQESTFKAQENVANQRLELVKKYQACAKNAGGDSKKLEACDSYLRAAEALK